MKKAYLLKHDSVTVEEIKPLPTFKEAQVLVGGYICMCTPLGTLDSQPVQLVVDEDGQMRHLPFNRIATALHMGLDVELRDFDGVQTGYVLDKIPVGAFNMRHETIVGNALVLIGWRLT